MGNKRWLVKWLGISIVPFVVAGVCLLLGLGPWLQGPEVRPPNGRGEPGTVRLCPSIGNDAAYDAMEGSTDPYDLACLDAREDHLALRRLLTRVGVGSGALGILVLVGTFAARSSREQRRLELELARRRAELGLSDDAAPSGPVDPIS